jgi:hypothetical protein
MGISIHYTGRLKTKKSLPNLIAEVKDIAEIYNWSYHIFDEEFPVGSFNKSSFNHHVYGICFTPPGCETVNLTFLSNGRLVSPWGLEYYFNKEKDERLLKGISVKTHYTGVTGHKLIIHLFLHLSKKYFRNFKLHDEGGYWETRDENLLEANFKFLNAMMDSLETALETQPKKATESFEKYFERLLNQIQISKGRS